MTTHDLETRERLLDAAARLFADRGFRKVTVREICREARANVAAINYHFGDKLGLYREVLQSAIDTMRATTELGRAAGEGLAPEEKLRRFFEVFAKRVLEDPRRAWIHRLVRREISDPTPVLDAIVAEGVKPRLEYLGTVVGEMLGRPAESDEVRRCVASIHALWMLFIPNPISSRLGAAFRVGVDEGPQVIADVAEFSIGGIRALAARGA